MHLFIVWVSVLFPGEPFHHSDVGIIYFPACLLFDGKTPFCTVLVLWKHWKYSISYRRKPME